MNDTPFSVSVYDTPTITDGKVFILKRLVLYTCFERSARMLRKLEINVWWVVHRPNTLAYLQKYVSTQVNVTNSHFRHIYYMCNTQTFRGSVLVLTVFLKFEFVLELIF